MLAHSLRSACLLQQPAEEEHKDACSRHRQRLPQVHARGIRDIAGDGDRQKNQSQKLQKSTKTIEHFPGLEKKEFLPSQELEGNRLLYDKPVRRRRLFLTPLRVDLKKASS